MKTYIYFSLLSSVLVSGSVYAACTPAPDCASLGYTVTSCPNGGVKCPFDTTKWYCPQLPKPQSPQRGQCCNNSPGWSTQYEFQTCTNQAKLPSCASVRDSCLSTGGISFIDYYLNEDGSIPNSCILECASNSRNVTGTITP